MSTGALSLILFDPFSRSPGFMFTEAPWQRLAGRARIDAPEGAETASRLRSTPGRINSRSDV